MPSRVRFSIQADADLEAIAAFSRENFGEAQEERYQKSLAAAFRLISSFPQMGMDTSDVKPEARRHVHGSHAIYYLVRDDEILILRVLGRGQEPESELAG